MKLVKKELEELRCKDSCNLCQKSVVPKRDNFMNYHYVFCFNRCWGKLVKKEQNSYELVMGD